PSDVRILHPERFYGACVFRGHLKVAVTCGSTFPQDVAATSLLVGDRRRRAVEFCELNGEGFVIRSGAVLQKAERNSLSQLERCVGIAPPVNPGVDAMSKADVMAKLVQLAVYGEAA